MPKTKIFISHAWEDKALAYDLEDKLESAGFDVWVDHSDVVPGNVFPEQVSKGIKECDTFSLIWSKAAHASHWVKREWATALNLNYLLLPVGII